MRDKLLKITSLIVSMLFVISLTGCESYQKSVAFAEYTTDLKSDLPYWEAAQAASESMQSARSDSEIVSYAELCHGYLDTIVANANKRNQTISDPEIKDIDDSYVSFVTSMRDGYSDLISGVKTGDADKFNRGILLVQEAENNSVMFTNKVSAFRQKYNFKSSSDLDDLEHALTGK